MDNFKPTNKKPLGKMGKKLEKQFSNNLKGIDIQLKEMDSVLTEKEQSFKKRFWDLSKMESLVHSDPILSAEYQEMSEDGQEKYGYHYNETIMNMLFNKYVTHDQGYQQKYLNAIPAKKERRDKSGINQLQQKGEEKMEKKKSSDKNEDVKKHNNSLEGVIEEHPLSDVMDNNLNTDGGGTFDDREYLNHRIEKNYDTMEEPIKKNQEVDETTGAASAGAYSPALGAKNNVYEGEDKSDEEKDIEREEGKDIDETTTSASSGAYVGPFRKKGKNHVTNKPAWKGGEIVSETKNYLTDEKYFKMIHESFGDPNDDTLVTLAENTITPEMVSKLDNQYLQRSLSDLLNTPNMGANDLVKMFQTELRKRGILKGGDVNEDNRFFDYDLGKLDTTILRKLLSDLLKTGGNENANLTKMFQKELRDRGVLKEPSNDPKSQNLIQKMSKWLRGESVEINEHHLDSSEDKIEFIISNGQNKFGDAEMLKDQDDETIDRIYREVESMMGISEAELNKPELNHPNLNEKSKSQSQQQFMGMVHAYKKGEMPDASDGVKKAAASMSDEDAKDFASTKHKGLPNKVEEADSQGRFVSYPKSLELAKILDNAPVEDEEKILNDFAEANQLSLYGLKLQIQNHIAQKLQGSESPEYFKMENIVTIINDMLDQEYSVTSDMKDRLRQDKESEQSMMDRSPNKKMAAAGDKAWANYNAFGGGKVEENVTGGSVDEIAMLLQKIFPNQYNDIEGFKNFAHLTVKTFFGGDYEKALQGIKSRMNKLVSNEGIISGTEGSIIDDNPTSMAGTMKGTGGMEMPMGEGNDVHDLTTNGRSDDVKFDANNSLDDFGISKGGFGGFNDASDGNHPHYKEPDKYGAPRNKDLSKYNNMTEENIAGINETKETVCENCGGALDEDGHCRRDEVPVAGKIAGQKGSCKKKKKRNKKADDNKFNVKFRNKKEKEMADKRERSRDDYKKELDKNKKHMKKLKEMMGIEGEELNEDKRPSALVQMDRLHKDNSKNFKADMNDSNTGEVAKSVAKDELTAQEQIEEVPENAYELAEKIEKDKLKQNKGESFENDGNSTNDNNKEIPKRNATDEEADDIMLNRGLGMQDIVYDNKPDERFEKRMEKDMGEQIYDQRQEKMKFRADAPMYNKDSQPIDDGKHETQFDKNVSKFNNPKGIKESVSAKYKDDFGNRKVITFKMNEAVQVEAPEGTKLSFDGMGNTYTQRVTENAEMRHMMDAFDYYVNGNKVVKVASGRQSLTESISEKQLINEEVQKMMKLAGYDPSKHVDTKGIKKNAKFKF